MGRDEFLGRPAYERGSIVAVAQAAGLALRNVGGPKIALACPLHDDGRPSAVLFVETNRFHCPVCIPGRSLGAREFAERLNVPLPAASAGVASRATPTSRPRNSAPSAFDRDGALRVFVKTQERARDDSRVAEDRFIYEYLGARGLMPSWEHLAFGVLALGMVVGQPYSDWAFYGYHIVAPLYDSRGDFAGMQSRNILGRDPKVKAPKGCAISGTAFANDAGLSVLRGARNGERVVVIGEGLTDTLAYSFASPFPTLSVPGTSVAASVFSDWVEGLTVVLALDVDDAGKAAIDRCCERAYGFGAARILRLEWPRGCKDACDVLRARGAEGLTRILEKNVRGRA